MNLQSLLDTRVTERSALVRLITSYLENDKRVKAAWLHGSLANGNHDALSDADLWVVVDDESAASIVSGRKKYATGLTRPSLVMDNVNNAPPSGAYLLVHYPGEVGPQHVDWFWQPESLAKRPDDALVLFDRADLPIVFGDEWRVETHQTGGGSPINETDQASIVTFKITFFWAMSLIVAKYIARGDSGTVHRMMDLITRTLGEINDVLSGKPRAESTDTTLISNVDVASASDQFAMLDRLVKAACRMEKPIEAVGGSIPSDGIRQIKRFFELTIQMAAS
jgi:hypothetical protein